MSLTCLANCFVCGAVQEMFNSLCKFITEIQFDASCLIKRKTLKETITTSQHIHHNVFFMGRLESEER